jgi:hypothetical protein
MPIITVLDDEILIAPLAPDEDLPPDADADRDAALVRVGLTLAELPF